MFKYNVLINNIEWLKIISYKKSDFFINIFFFYLYIDFVPEAAKQK